MDTYKLRKACVSMGVVILCIIFFTSNAFSWGSATHAYIDDKIGKTLPFKNLNEIYGGMAPDIFNFYPEVLQDGTAYNYLYIQTHYNSLALWSEAQSATDFGKASAFGFASHANGQFGSSYAGADYIAHDSWQDGPGYVIAKAEALWAYLRPIIPENIIPNNEAGNEMGLSISHNIIEFAIDIMVVYEIGDGGRIGKKMIESALLRSPEFPLLLAKTYAKDLSSAFRMSRHAAVEMIVSAERDFRKTMLIYGQGLVQEDETAAINYVATLLAQMAVEIYGINAEQELLLGLVKIAISGAQISCAGDYQGAINETIDFVKDQMTGAGISY